MVDNALGSSRHNDEKDEVLQLDGPTIGMKQRCIEHAISATSQHHVVDNASHISSSSQNLAILAAVAVADLE